MTTPSPASTPDGPTAASVVPPRVLGFLLQAALAASIVATGAAAAAQWRLRSVLEPLPDEAKAVAADGYQRADMWVGNTHGVQQACLSVTVLLLVVWFFRMRSNALVLEPSWPQRHGIGWLLLSCLCAVGLLFVPKMIVNDVWAASTPPPDQRRGNALLTVWWLAVLVAAGELSRGFPLLDDAAGDLLTIGDALLDLFIGDFAAVAACLLTFVVVRRLGALQAARSA